MGYKYTSALYCANRAAAIANLDTQLLAMGWLAHDSQPTNVTVAYTAVDLANNLINANAHGLVNGQRVLFSSTGTAPGGLTLLNYYFIVGVAANTFQLSLTQGGAAIDLITQQGTGNHTFGEGYRVYKSNAEAGDRIYEYIYVEFGATANAIKFLAYYYWNATTHAGVGAACGASFGSMTLTTAETGFYFWIYGNKNLVFCCTKVASTYYPHIFGHLPSVYWTVETTTTAQINAGSPVSIPVADSSAFNIGSSYQIVGNAGEGRDWITVTAKADGTHITAIILRTYAAGAKIGQFPARFVMLTTLSGGSFRFAGTCSYSSAGTAASNSNDWFQVDKLLDPGAIDPDLRGESSWVLTPLVVWESCSGAQSTGIVSIFAEYIYLCGYTGVTNEDTIHVTQLDSGTATSGASMQLNDTGKNWGVNTYQNKVVVITGGVGAGQIKKIASNTATRLVPDVDWVTNPTNTSTYVIAEEAYRCMIPNIYFSLAIREGV